MEITTGPASPAEDLDPLMRPPRWGGPRVWAGAVLLLAGIGLIGLAGCFLIGAMSLVKPQLIEPKLQGDSLSPHASLLLGILYGVAGGCLVLALVLIFLGARGLLRVLMEKAT
jgi:hypothetical protein